MHSQARSPTGSSSPSSMSTARRSTSRPATWDIYLFGLKTDAARDLQGTEGVELIEAAGHEPLAHPQPGA